MEGGEVSRCRNTDTGSCSTDSASARTGADRRPGHRVKLCVRLLGPGYLCVRGCSCQARVLVSLCSPVSAAAGLVSTVLQLLPSPAHRPARTTDSTAGVKTDRGHRASGSARQEGYCCTRRQSWDIAAVSTLACWPICSCGVAGAV